MQSQAAFLTKVFLLKNVAVFIKHYAVSINVQWVYLCYF